MGHRAPHSLSRAGPVFHDSQHDQIDHLCPPRPGDEHAVCGRHRLVYQDAVRAGRHASGHDRRGAGRGRLERGAAGPVGFPSLLGAMASVSCHFSGRSDVRLDRKHERRAQIPAIVVLGVMLVAPPAPAQSPDNDLLKEYGKKIQRQSAVLDSIRGELEQGRSRLHELARKEGSYLEQLAVLEKNMETAERYIDELSNRIDTVSVHIDVLGDSLAGATDALERRQAVMMRRLRTMYKTGRPGLLQVVVSSANITDMLHRIKYFQELKNYDQALVRAIDSTRAVIRARTDTLEERRDQLTALREVKEAEQGTLREERRAREETLAQVRDEKEAYEQMVAELETAQQELTSLLKTLEKRRAKARLDFERGRKTAFETRKGSLPWPVEGDVVKRFGKIVHPVYKTVTMSPGIDIAASRGGQVFCVAPGRVDYVGWMRGYGKFVIVNHYGGFVTIYAHLGAIAVSADQEVAYGSVLGVVGETGSLTGAKLNFQVRQETVPMDPQDWLEPRE
ncbi:MAG: peptidoglycan DD-metalloendopeptidase family protein [Chitinivibrionales bacterium]|nr:peptidoglycan DD-metalloendopeptidase family protein [Chitinivibrionales bacterium]MBD3395003.1 peptidoglycan DD-metalloendopeptidase family protein [Chitinivibrionales bacterium]